MSEPGGERVSIKKFTEVTSLRQDYGLAGQCRVGKSRLLRQNRADKPGTAVTGDGKNDSKNDVGILGAHRRDRRRHRDDAKRFVVRADEKLTAFLELERAACIPLSD